MIWWFRPNVIFINYLLNKLILMIYSPRFSSYQYLLLNYKNWNSYVNVRPKNSPSLSLIWLTYSGWDLCKVPLFTFSLTVETQTQVFGCFRHKSLLILPKYPLNPPRIPDNQASKGDQGRISGYLKQKQPKTCVWGFGCWKERNFAKVSCCFPDTLMF